MNPTNGKAVETDRGETDSKAVEAKSWVGVPDYLIPVRKIEAAVGPSESRRMAAKARFVKGPILMDWLAAIANSGHAKAIHVVLAIKMQSDRYRETWVNAPYEELAKRGVNRVDLSRALAALERAGLMEVRRSKGRPSLVRLVPWKGSVDV
jgi:hypothetical protein